VQKTALLNFCTPSKYVQKTALLNFCTPASGFAEDRSWQKNDIDRLFRFLEKLKLKFYISDFPENQDRILAFPYFSANYPHDLHSLAESCINSLGNNI